MTIDSNFARIKVVDFAAPVFLMKRLPDDLFYRDLDRIF